METTLAATSKVAGTTAIGTSVHCDFAIRCSMSIVVVSQVMVAHVALVVHYSCALVVHRSIAMSHCRSRIFYFTPYNEVYIIQISFLHFSSSSIKLYHTVLMYVCICD